MTPSRIYKGSELVYERPSSAPLTAFLTGLQNGDRIQLFRAANIRTDAVIATNTLKGVNVSGARGTVVGGPRTGIQNSIWYDINFDTGFDGWVVSDNYTQIAANAPVQTTPSTFRVGDRVRLFRAANVRSSVGIANNLLGVNPANAEGVITVGPTLNGSVNWYRINFDAGHDGWVASDNYVKVSTSSSGGGGGGAAPGGGVVTTPAVPGTCRQIWTPSNSAICGGRWAIQVNPAGTRRARVSCATSPDGGSSIMVSEFANDALSLTKYTERIPAISTAGAARVQVEMYIPPNFNSDGGGMRHPLGLEILGSGPGCAGGGGCPASNANGAVIKLSSTGTSNGSFNFGLYSYHVNRNVPIEVRSNQFGSAVQPRQPGASNKSNSVAPKGEWFTLTIEVVLGSPGQPNGSSKLTIHNSRGALIGTAGFSNAIYRKDASWKFIGFNGDHKSAGTYKPPQNQQYYLRNYKMFAC